MNDYKLPVHKSLLPRILIGGISKISIAIIFFLTSIFVMGFGQIWFLAVSLAGYLLLRYATQKDEYLVEIFISYLKEPQVLEP